MATPITWQNINGASPAEASRPLEAAQRAFSGMFSQLGDVITQREGINEKNWQNTKTNNTQAFLDRLASYRTPEELAAAQKSGAIDQLRAQFGNQIDAAAVRGADEQRRSALQTQAQQAIAFDGVMRNEKTAPLVDKLRGAIINGNQADAATSRAALAELGYRNFSDQDAFADQRGQIVTERSRDTTRFGREGEKHLADIADQKARQEIARGQLAVSQGGLGIQRQELELRRGESNERREERLSKLINETAVARSKLKDVSLNSTEGQETMAKYIRDNFKDPAIAASLLAKANKVAQTGFQKDGQNIPVSVGAMMQAIGGTQDTRWGITKWLNDSDQADYVQPNLEKVLLSPAYQEGLSKQAKQSTSLDSELDRLKSRITSSTRTTK
jgi:hypothetical protein